MEEIKPSKGVKPLNFASVVKSMDTVSLRKECSLEAFFYLFSPFFFFFFELLFTISSLVMLWSGESLETCLFSVFV